MLKFSCFSSTERTKPIKRVVQVQILTRLPNVKNVIYSDVYSLQHALDVLVTHWNDRVHSIDLIDEHEDFHYVYVDDYSDSEMV